MSHNIGLYVFKNDDIVKYDIKNAYDLNNSGYSVLDPDYFYEDFPITDYLYVSTDYFGGCGEQYSESSSEIFRSINAGLEKVFGIKRTDEMDQFDMIGLGKIRSNSDLKRFKYPENIVNLIKDPNVLNIYMFGSKVYGSDTPESDTDYIVIAEEFFDSKNTDIHVYTVENFKSLLVRHDIQALECVCLDRKFILKEMIKFDIPVIDKSKLRVSISTIASNSWVKGKKKLTVTGDYNVNLAIKSIFHSLRILDFGIQLAQSGKIQRFDSSNFILGDLKKIAGEYQSVELWNKIDDKYRKIYNSRSSHFKELAPKDTSENESKKELSNILKKYDIFANDDMLNDILNTIKK